MDNQNKSVKHWESKPINQVFQPNMGFKWHPRIYKYSIRGYKRKWGEETGQEASSYHLPLAPLFHPFSFVLYSLVWGKETVFKIFLLSLKTTDLQLSKQIIRFFFLNTVSKYIFSYSKKIIALWFCPPDNES